MILDIAPETRRFLFRVDSPNKHVNNKNNNSRGSNRNNMLHVDCRVAGLSKWGSEAGNTLTDVATFRPATRK